MGFSKIITKIGLGFKKHSPEILAGVGAVAIVGGVVWACKSAVDSADDIQKCKDDVAEIKQSIKDEVIDEKAGKKAIFNARIECAKSCSVRFVGPIALIGGGLYCQHKSRSIIGKRLDGVAAVLAAERNRYSVLAENVKKEYGEAEFQRLQYGIVDGTAEVRETDETTGIETARMEKFDDVVDLSKIGKFTLTFDHNSSHHYNDVDHNVAYLKRMESVFTETLQRKGILWLSDVMKELDIQPRTKEEALLARVICWTWDTTDENKDCHVDLRFKRVHDSNSRNYDTGFNPVFVLDPNYDTNINEDWYKFMR